MNLKTSSSILLFLLTISECNSFDLNNSIAPSLTNPSQCTDTRGWNYQYWDYTSGCHSQFRILPCESDIVKCSYIGSSGRAAMDHCCKCNLLCSAGACPEYRFRPDTTTFGCVEEDSNDDGPVPVVIVGVLCILVCCASVLCYQRCESAEDETEANTPRDATRQTMAARRQQQRENNTTSQGLTEEERDHSRYEQFLTKFHFQSVLPDKSNITATSMRKISAFKPDEEDPTEALNDDDDDASAVGNPVSRRKHISLSERLSSWRRPSAKDECCICLECYVVGETICAPITTECNHVFHEGCINQWLKNNEHCPLCRVELLKD